MHKLKERIDLDITQRIPDAAKQCGEGDDPVAPDVDVTLGCASLQEFARDLTTRTVVSERILLRYAESDRESLADEMARLQWAQSEVCDMLVGQLESPGNLGAVLRAADATCFPRDQGWEHLMTRLNGLPETHDPFKLLAVTKLRQYLLACNDVLIRIWRQRFDTPLPELDLGSHRSRTKITFSVRHDDSSEKRLVRLPRAKPVKVDYLSGELTRLWLGARRFHVDNHCNTFITDECGQRLNLREGRNMVGRALYNDVVIDPDYKDVSRRHLLIEVTNGRIATLTDLSSQGTMIPGHNLYGCWSCAGDVAPRASE